MNNLHCGSTTNHSYPPSTANHQELADSNASRSNDRPRFYAKDITSILEEKNKLKERVVELEEEIITLKREITKESPADSRKEITRLSKFGTLTLDPKVTLLRADTFLLEESEKRSAAAAAFRKPLKCCKNAPLHITSVDVTSYKKKGRFYVYVIEVIWSDGQRYAIYRRYGEFFTFQHTLLQLFPEQGGKKKSTIRILPSLPTIDNVLSLFGRTNTESVVKARLATINEYCQILLLHLDLKVSRSSYVLNFFRPTVGDTQLSKLAKRASDVDLSMLSVYPQNVPPGTLFEDHVVLADYEASTNSEISAKAGDKVKVIKKEDSGWWLVIKTTPDGDEIGYISSDYLKLYKGGRETLQSSEGGIQKYLGHACRDSTDVSVMELSYVALEDYQTNDPQQLCLEKEKTVLVIEKSEDGWWLAVSGKRQGWVPASYLKREDQGGDAGSDEEMTSQDGVGEKYVATASYCGEYQEDISFPEGAMVEILERSASGWWMIRYNGVIGVAPASFLGIPSTPVIEKETPLPSLLDKSVEMEHCISGIVTPPPRSKAFIRNTRKKMAERASLKIPHEEASEMVASETGMHAGYSATASLSRDPPKPLLGLKMKAIIRSPLSRRKTPETSKSKHSPSLN